MAAIVMRKLVILARGVRAGAGAGAGQGRVTGACRAGRFETWTVFFEQAGILDELLAERLARAQSRRTRCCVMSARLDRKGKAVVGVEALPQEHALANLLPCDNIFCPSKSRWLP